MPESESKSEYKSNSSQSVNTLSLSDRLTIIMSLAYLFFNILTFFLAVMSVLFPHLAVLGLITVIASIVWSYIDVLGGILLVIDADVPNKIDAFSYIGNWLSSGQLFIVTTAFLVLFITQHGAPVFQVLCGFSFAVCMLIASIIEIRKMLLASTNTKQRKQHAKNAIAWLFCFIAMLLPGIFSVAVLGASASSIFFILAPVVAVMSATFRYVVDKQQIKPFKNNSQWIQIGLFFFVGCLTSLGMLGQALLLPVAIVDLMTFCIISAIVCLACVFIINVLFSDKRFLSTMSCTICCKWACLFFAVVTAGLGLVLHPLSFFAVSPLLFVSLGFMIASVLLYVINLCQNGKPAQRGNVDTCLCDCLPWPCATINDNTLLESVNYTQIKTQQEVGGTSIEDGMQQQH